MSKEKHFALARATLFKMSTGEHRVRASTPIVADRCRPLFASMQPRSEDRGEPGSRRGPSERRTYFNAATVRRPWRTPQAGIARKRGPVLQCGHGQNAVENR